MPTTQSLCFGRDGVINPEALAFYADKKIDLLVLCGDGTPEAYDHMRSFDYGPSVTSPRQMAIAQLPLFDLRVKNPNGSVSKPNYVYSDKNKIDWFCANICAPCVRVFASDMASTSDTKVELNRAQTVALCRMAYSFWSMLKVAEDHLGFPAMAIDLLTRHSRSLKEESLDVGALRTETGIASLDYHNGTKMLSVMVGGEISMVKLEILDDFLVEHILPFFNRHRGRRYLLDVQVVGQQDTTTMTYGQLGFWMSQMEYLVEDTKITADDPMTPDDLLAFSKELIIHGESCVFGGEDQTFDAFWDTARSVVVRPADHPERVDLLAESSKQVETV